MNKLATLALVPSLACLACTTAEGYADLDPATQDSEPTADSGVEPDDAAVRDAATLPGDAGHDAAQPPPALPRSPFVQRHGRSLTQNGKEIRWRGFAFGNDVWSGLETPPWHHHGQADYARVAQFGANVVRFYLSYKTFERDSAPYEYLDAAWEWLDANLYWAKLNNVSLILNMHIPQGGYQSLDEGGALWTNRENQDRLVALWRAIAERYANEPYVAGYDLLNEARVTESGDQWWSLAERLRQSIREVDPNHVLIVEQLNRVGERYISDPDEGFSLIADENTIYTFHFYDPVRYSLQQGSWTGFPPAVYPDPTQTEWIDRRSYAWNKTYLRASLERYANWSAAHDVPLFVGEWGLIRHCFDDRGGLTWISDTLDLLERFGFHHTLHSYKDSLFGLYRNLESDEDANLPLIELLQQKFTSF